MVLGIMILEKDFLSNRGRKDDSISYKILVGKKDGSTIFVTNKSIRDAIKAHPQVVGKEIGEINLFVSTTQKLLDFTYYYPIGPHGISGKFTRDSRVVFQGTGTASLIELAIQKRLLEKFPDFFITTTYPTNDRIRQLKKQKIKMYETILLAESVRRLENYVRSQGMKKRIHIASAQRMKKVGAFMLTRGPKFKSKRK